MIDFDNKNQVAWLINLKKKSKLINLDCCGIFLNLFIKFLSYFPWFVSIFQNEIKNWIDIHFIMKHEYFSLSQNIPLVMDFVLVRLKCKPIKFFPVVKNQTSLWSRAALINEWTKKFVGSQKFHHQFRPEKPSR